MTKERYRSEAGGRLHNFILGAIVEWGSYDESLLSESDLNLLALTTFTKEVDIIEFASADMDTINKMKLHGFIKHGDARIGFRDKKKKYKDASDIKNWRIRYGYADLILT